MACACKVKREIEKKYENANGTYEKKGFNFYMSYFLNDIFLRRIFMPLFLFVLCIFLMPLIVIMLILTQIFSGEARIIIPKSMQRIFNKAEKSKINE